MQSVAVFPTFVISGKSFHLSELIFLAENLRMWGGGGKGDTAVSHGPERDECKMLKSCTSEWNHDADHREFL